MAEFSDLQDAETRKRRVLYINHRIHLNTCGGSLEALQGTSVPRFHPQAMEGLRVRSLICRETQELRNIVIAIT